MPIGMDYINVSSSMNRRDFLKKSSLTALLATGELTGLSKAFANAPSTASQLNSESADTNDTTPRI